MSNRLSDLINLYKVLLLFFNLKKKIYFSVVSSQKIIDIEKRQKWEISSQRASSNQKNIFFLSEYLLFVKIILKQRQSTNLIFDSKF